MAQTETKDASNSSNAVAAAADALLQLPSKLDAHAKKNTSNEASRGRSKANNNGALASSRLPPEPEPTAGKRAPDEPVEAIDRGDSGSHGALPTSTAQSSSASAQGCAQKKSAPAANASSSFRVGTPKVNERSATTTKTTARKRTNGDKKQAKKPSKGPRIRRGARFKVKRDKLKLAIKADQRPEAWAIIEQYTRRDYNFYGTVLGSKHQGLYNVRIDLFPMLDNEVKISREHLVAVDQDEEEKPYDREEKAVDDFLEECSGEGKSARVNHAKESVASFLALKTEEQVRATCFQMSVCFQLVH